MPIITHAPRRTIGHWDPYYFGNSKKGIKKTADHHIDWHDLDHGITKDGRWRIAHGNPEKVYFHGKRMRDFTSAVINKMRYKGFRIGWPKGFYRYAKSLGVNIEIEPKSKDPRYKSVAQWRKLASICKAVWGENWADHVYVKILDINGKEFAVDVIKAASAAGFPAGPTRDWDVPKKMLD